MSALACEEVERFRAIIADRLGLHLDEGRQVLLAQTLRERLALTGARQPDAYLADLAGGAVGSAEMRALATALTVGETYFFRNPDHFGAVLHTVFPERVRTQSHRRTLKILSAGCSSGDEAHTLAILVREAAELGPWQVSITGIDVNPAMIAKASQGIYSGWALRQTSDEVRRRWFKPAGRDFVLDEQIRKMASFEERNLVVEDPSFWCRDAFDIVFCRNVTMYFSIEVARKLIARIARSLTPGGYLFLGHAETLRGLSNQFHLRHTDETFYYQRHDGLEPEPEAFPRVIAGAPITLDGDVSWAEVIQRSSQRIADLTRPTPVDTPLPATWDLGQARALLQAERFTEALALLRDLPPASRMDADAQLLRAALLTHSGHLAAAEAVCKELLFLDELNAGAHYLMALCREHAGDRDGAIEHDLKAAYLDPEFAMPRLHLGLLARRLGDLPGARQQLEQASVLLGREDPARILLFGGGFHREALARLCSSELKACEAAR